MEPRMKFRRLFTGRLPILLSVLAMGGLLLGARPAFAQGTCIQDVWKAHGNSQNLNCTANDVQISNVTNIDIIAGGKCETVNGVKICYCYQGQNVTFEADFEMLLTAQTRYDIGFYIATDGDQNTWGALEGQCASTNVTSTNAPVTFYNLDPSPDVCGDILGPAGTAYNPQIVRFQVTMPCIPDANGKLALPYCTTWRQPGSNQVCLGTGNSSASNDVYPGSPSKCFCGLREIDIFTETATIEVTKTNLSGDVPETGGPVTYSVSVKNLAQVSHVKLDSLTDNIYGNITTTGHDGITSTTCVPDGDAATCEVCNSAIATCKVNNATIAAGATCSCTFTVTAPPGDFDQVVTDIVTACGTDEFGHTNLCDDDDASFKYTDVEQPPSVSKTATGSSNISCSVDVNYTVVVQNTSAANPGDSLTLNSLIDDKYGDITQVGGKIISTNCAVPQTITYGNNYSCMFVGRVACSDLSGSQLKDTVTANATDDDGVTYTPSDDATVQIIVNVSFP